MSGEAVDISQSREQTKSSRGHQWRDRLKDKATKLTKGTRPPQEQRDQNVSDFLSSSSTSEARSSHKTPPQIDTSAGAVSLSPEESLNAPSFSSTQFPIRKKRPKPPGIHVTFSEIEPDIIGEGGDEADVPAKDVITSWASQYEYTQTTSRPSQGQGTETQPVNAYGALLQLEVDDRSRRASLQRAPTRHRPDGYWEIKRQSMAAEEALAQVQREDKVEDDSSSLYTGAGQARNDPQNSIDLQRPADSHARNENPAPYTSRPSPNVSAPDLDVANGTPFTPFTEKPYMSSNTADEKRHPERVSNGSQSGPQAFLAYNPSLKRPVESVTKSGSRQISAHAENTAFPAAKDRSLDEDTMVSQNPPRDTFQSQEAPPMQSTHNSPSNMPRSSKNSSGPPAQQQYLPAGSTIENGAEAAEDFYHRMQHMRGTFRLAAEKSRVGDKTMVQWLRASVWWFLRGKTMLEANVRVPSQDRDRPGSQGRESTLPTNKQCYVDIAKALWIYEEKIFNVENLERTNNALTDRIDGLEPALSSMIAKQVKMEMQAFIHSLKKRNLLPPPALLVQGADPEIWIQYPSLPPGIHTLTATLDSRTLSKYIPPNTQPFFSMPLSDTDLFFNYGRVFGEVMVLHDDVPVEANRFLCIVSILRQRIVSFVEFLVTSQDGQINFRIQSDAIYGPTWDQVEWKVKAQTLDVRLSQNTMVAIRFREADFKTLWGIQDYNRRVELDKSPRADEELLFSDLVSAFHYVRPQDTQAGFPVGAVKNCKVRLFQKNSVYKDGAVRRHIFSGYRLVAVTPSNSKTLSSVSIDLGDNGPILYNNLRGEKEAPALLVQELDKKASVVMTFVNPKERAQLHTILAAIATSPDESFSDEIPFSNMTLRLLNDPAGRQITELSMPQNIQWQKLKVINQGFSLEESQFVLSDRLRVCMSCNYGTVTDRINLGAGELCVSLDALSTSSISFYRPAQNSLMVSFAGNLVPKSEISAIQSTLNAIASAPTARSYNFSSLSDLHHFQALVTGYSVIYDGQATSFSITRRRMVVPIHKRLEATLARVQVIQQDNITQLLAFLKDFPRGKCMNFVLRGTDVFESYSKAGKFFVKFIEAKFALPKSEKTERWDMVCLDMVEYPTEHDDITFGFDSEDERNLFATALPAGLSKASRMTSFRK